MTGSQPASIWCGSEPLCRNRASAAAPTSRSTLRYARNTTSSGDAHDAVAVDMSGASLDVELAELQNDRRFLRPGRVRRAGGLQRAHGPHHGAPESPREPGTRKRESRRRTCRRGFTIPWEGRAWQTRHRPVTRTGLGRTQVFSVWPIAAQAISTPSLLYDTRRTPMRGATGGQARFGKKCEVTATQRKMLEDDQRSRTMTATPSIRWRGTPQFRPRARDCHTASDVYKGPRLKEACIRLSSEGRQAPGRRRRMCDQCISDDRLEDRLQGTYGLTALPLLGQALPKARKSSARGTLPQVAGDADGPGRCW